MQQTYFSKTNAKGLLGKRVRAAADLADVPMGTFGRVNGWQEVDRRGEYSVIVCFEPTSTTQPVLKWLSKSEFYHFLQEAP
jgi:hypothetical protein